MTNIIYEQEVERQESSASTDTEQSEFDKEAIVGKVPTKEELEALKPNLVGKTFNVMPMSNKDQGISGLCSIMWCSYCTQSSAKSLFKYCENVDWLKSN